MPSCGVFKSDQGALPDTLFILLFIVAAFILQLPQVLQPTQAPQEAQLPPQERFPAFLSRTMPRISRATINVMTATSIRLIQLAESQASISITSFKRGRGAVRREVLKSTQRRNRRGVRET